MEILRPQSPSLFLLGMNHTPVRAFFSSRLGSSTVEHAAKSTRDEGSTPFLGSIRQVSTRQGAALSVPAKKGQRGASFL
jgi:hypothetical protein